MRGESSNMLTKIEAEKIAEACEKWPGGRGCVLVPSNYTSRGYKIANWGWQGRVRGDFTYAHLQEFDENALFCPVTTLGMVRGVKDFTGHMDAYSDIRAAVMSLLEVTQKEAQNRYNSMLSYEPKKLAALFRLYAEIQGE